MRRGGNIIRRLAAVIAQWRLLAAAAITPQHFTIFSRLPDQWQRSTAAVTGIAKGQLGTAATAAPEIVMPTPHREAAGAVRHWLRTGL